LKSTSTLGQFPTNPLSAQQRVDKREDLDVRRALHKAARRNGVSGEVSDDDNEDLKDMTGDREDDTLRFREAKRLKRAEKNGTIVEADENEQPLEKSIKSSVTSNPANKSKKKKKTKKVGVCSGPDCKIANNSYPTPG
jgi:hypothetical protein